MSTLGQQRNTGGQPGGPPRQPPSGLLAIHPPDDSSLAMIKTWQASTASETEITEVGIFGQLLRACLDLFGSILRTPNSALLPEKTEKRLHRHYDTLRLWGDGHNVFQGKLDALLDTSKHLRQITLITINSLCEVILKRLASVVLPESEEVRCAIINETNVAVLYERTKWLLSNSEDPVEESDSENDSDNSSDAEDRNNLESITIEIGNYIQCLVDLNIALECPAPDADEPEETTFIDNPSQRNAYDYYADLIVVKYPKADIELAKRLGKANWERYQRMQLERSRNIKTSATMGLPEIPETSASKSRIADSDFRDSGLGTSLPAPSTSYAATIISFVSSISGRRDKIPIPPLPLEAKNGEPFECLACGKMIAARTNREWRKHLFSENDLRPYTCFHPGCNFNFIPFRDRRTWSDHLDLDHSFGPLWESQQCVLCLESTGGGRNDILLHYSHHMEEIACAALPRGVDSDEESSDSEKDPPDSEKNPTDSDRTAQNGVVEGNEEHGELVLSKTQQSAISSRNGLDDPNILKAYTQMNDTIEGIDNVNQQLLCCLECRNKQEKCNQRRPRCGRCKNRDSSCAYLNSEGVYESTTVAFPQSRNFASGAGTCVPCRKEKIWCGRELPECETCIDKAVKCAYDEFQMPVLGGSRVRFHCAEYKHCNDVFEKMDQLENHIREHKDVAGLEPLAYGDLWATFGKHELHMQTHNNDLTDASDQANTVTHLPPEQHNTQTLGPGRYTPKKYEPTFLEDDLDDPDDQLFSPIPVQQRRMTSADFSKPNHSKSSDGLHDPQSLGLQQFENPQGLTEANDFMKQHPPDQTIIETPLTTHEPVTDMDKRCMSTADIPKPVPTISYENQSSREELATAAVEGSASGSTAPSLSELPDQLLCDVDGCSKTFTGAYRKRNLARHREIHHRRGDGWAVTFQCEKCHKEFRRKDARMIHYQRHHPELVNTYLCRVPGCYRGNRGFVTEFALRSHQRGAHGEKVSWKCSEPNCDPGAQGFSSALQLSKHYKDVHGIDRVVVDGS
ncbi:hypothetical protein P154DRAFT_560119 [Amniculicola lignicola CBS 123094]|uniref:C2H2-type domain-containing protein n=1 Tax=Amniculicola lignicola CBS 123094 TaxID=1392246 RepID=A0A6A5X141_9PLEO|nr:hypothetical protein P154DRAFT_560119 [Amniculicola lignicola CBS 123094]